METIQIAFKVKTPLVELLLQEENIGVLKGQSLLQKLTFSSKKYPDIYFHHGKLDKESLEMVKHARINIVNSHHVKQEIIQKIDFDANNIEVIYPTFIAKEMNQKEAKKEFFEQLKLDKTTKIILFTANNLKANGIKEFIHTILNLNSTNFRVIIASDTQQITNLRFQISKYNFEDKVLLYENFDNIDLLFAVADIFVLPTHNHSFASNILKAMYYKTAVFVSEHNHSSELVDVFATMHTPNDPSTAFKIDALLSRNEDLKVIKKQNCKTAKQFTIEKELEKLKEIVKVLNKS
jgi:hypothetical protein